MKTLLTVIVLMSVSVLAISKKAKNIIKNGEFEKLTENGSPADWDGNGFIMSSTESAKNGKRAIVIWNRDGFWAGAGQDIGYRHAGRRYMVSAWVRLANTDDDAHYVIQMMASFEENGKIIHSIMGKAHTSTKRWTRIQENYEFPKNMKGNVRIYFQGQYIRAPHYDFNVDAVEMTLWKESSTWREDANKQIEKIRKRDMRIT